MPWSSWKIALSKISEEKKLKEAVSKEKRGPNCGVESSLDVSDEHNCTNCKHWFGKYFEPTNDFPQAKTIGACKLFDDLTNEPEKHCCKYYCNTKN